MQIKHWDVQCVCGYLSSVLSRWLLRLSLGLCLVKISRARSSYSCLCSGDRLSRDSSLMKAREQVPNARFAEEQMANKE